MSLVSSLSLDVNWDYIRLFLNFANNLSDLIRIHLIMDTRQIHLLMDIWMSQRVLSRTMQWIKNTIFRIMQRIYKTQFQSLLLIFSFLCTPFNFIQITRLTCDNYWLPLTFSHYKQNIIPLNITRNTKICYLFRSQSLFHFNKPKILQNRYVQTHHMESFIDN